MLIFSRLSITHLPRHLPHEMVSNYILLPLNTIYVKQGEFDRTSRIPTWCSPKYNTIQIISCLLFFNEYASILRLIKFQIYLNLKSYNCPQITLTVFVNTRLSKTKHPRVFYFPKSRINENGGKKRAFSVMPCMAAFPFHLPQEMLIRKIAPHLLSPCGLTRDTAITRPKNCH